MTFSKGPAVLGTAPLNESGASDKEGALLVNQQPDQTALRMAHFRVECRASCSLPACRTRRSLLHSSGRQPARHLSAATRKPASKPAEKPSHRRRGLFVLLFVVRLPGDFKAGWGGA